MKRRNLYVAVKGGRVTELKLREEEIDGPCEEEMLLKARLSLPSVGTELAWLSGKMGDRAGGVGYSSVGVVQQVGAKVTKFAEGDRLFCFFNHADHYLYDQDVICFKPPAEVTDRQAAFTALGMVAMYTIERSAIGIGRPVVVVGQGSVGQLTQQFARLGGAGKVIAVDVNNKRLELSTRLGADAAIPPDKEVLEAALADVVEGSPAPVFIEISGASSAVKWILDVAPLRSRVVLTGTYQDPITIQPFLFIDRELDLVGAHQPKCPDHATRWFPYTKVFNAEYFYRCVVAGKVQVDPLCDDTIGPDELVGFYRDALDGRPRPAQPMVDWEDK
jgi:2-desacetyl-2-hydroxyethyl bacteriochlorophyllide A dehydrogenase